MKQCLASLFTLLAASIPVTDGRAGSCTDTVATKSCSTELSNRLDGILLVDPTDGRAEKRLSGTPWIAPAWELAPIAATPTEATETGFKLQTSVGQWSGYANHSMSVKIEEAKKLAPEGFKLPRVAPRPDPNLDVWASINASGLGVEASREVGSKVGVDYLIGRKVLLGVAVGLGDKATQSAALPGVTAEGSYALASYFAVKPLPTMTLETRAGIVEHRTAALDRTVDIQHRFIVAQLRSDFFFSRLKISPALSLAHGDDTIKDIPAAATGELSTLAFTPRVSHPFEIGRGQRLEPFIHYDRKLELGASDMKADDTAIPSGRSQKRLGAGIKLDKPDTYSLSVTTDIEETTSPTVPSNVKSRLELKIPIR